MVASALFAMSKIHKCLRVAVYWDTRKAGNKKAEKSKLIVLTVAVVNLTHITPRAQTLQCCRAGGPSA